ncbi:alpha/beta hydrolase [Paracoccus liaowanqingii]|uniref:Alpha/beta hydrolase n=1 Tax=Paracoccus liaowanqingii TaxID=2560053 RepID=A0A4Z1CL15_9RHOB|nr:alpha/beta hydrolase [Paracoccus liaowanqingii]TGN56394.1 alpha/beta hydrolase [Paracoccus liaowanqingii]
MSREFDWTAEERAAKAQELRANSLIATTLTPEMEADLQLVDVTELSVLTRAGASRVLQVVPKAEREGLRPLVINLHGSGFVRGYQHRDTVFCAHLASQLDAVVLDIDYRLAPEHPFPTALHEIYDITAWAFANAGRLEVDPARIALGGHSAGGNLTAAVCLMASRSGDFKICAQFLDYPFLDAVTEPEDKLEPHSIFSADRLRAFSALYGVKRVNFSNPLMSPLYADPAQLKKQPPAFIMIAGLDPLRREAQRYAGCLVDAGVDVTVRQFEDCDHGFLIAGQARHLEARKVLVDWLHQRLGDQD